MPRAMRSAWSPPSRGSCARSSLCCRRSLSPAEFARLVEMAMYAAKSQYPAMQPADAFLEDMAVMVRTLCAGAKPNRSRNPRRDPRRNRPSHPSRRRHSGKSRHAGRLEDIHDHDDRQRPRRIPARRSRRAADRGGARPVQAHRHQARVRWRASAAPAPCWSTARRSRAA